MKHIFDIYEDGTIAATPGNTMGMGNPMPAGEGTIGSEPLVGKKAKCKKEKCKKEVKEGILDDIETNLQVGDDIIKFANWIAEQHVEIYPKIKSEDVINKLISGITISGNTAILDINKIYNTGNFIMNFSEDRLILTNKGVKALPKNIKTLKYINCEYGLRVISIVSDISNINFEVYIDEGRTYADINMNFPNKYVKSGTIKLGKVTGDKLEISNSNIDSLMIDTDSTIIELDLQECGGLSRIYGKMPSTLYKLKLNKYTVDGLLKNQGIISWSTNLTIV